MRLSFRLTLLLSALLLNGPSWVDAANPKNAGNLYLLTINVGTHDPKGTPDDWNYTVDELERVVKAQCAPLFRDMKSNLVKGSQATPKGVLAGFDWLVDNVKEQDLALIYIGSHGGTDAKRGFCLYANKGNVYGDEIKPAVAKVKGKVVLVIQACCAGDILLKHKNDLEAMPKNVAAICACKASQHSHGIMLPPILEALHGFADADKDGVVTVGEFIQYINHRIGDFYPGKLAADQEAVMSEPKDFDLSMPLAKSLPAKKLGKEVIMGEWKGDWYGGVIVPKDDPLKKGRHLVHFFGDKDGEEEWMEKDWICPHEAEAVIVKSGAKWYTAALLKHNGDKCDIRYVGAFDNKEETVTQDRVRAYSLAAGEKKGK
jgi:hypothetical protein